ncbi:MAG: hypothetical protein HQL90_02925 [Magnetococcales bacterium]|nr:hypothetical protein [Magnetococcales bacterium]
MSVVLWLRCVARDAARQVANLLPTRSGGWEPVARGEKRAAFAACRGVCAVWHVGGVVAAGCGRGCGQAGGRRTANTEWWLVSARWWFVSGFGGFLQDGVVAGYPSRQAAA